MTGLVTAASRYVCSAHLEPVTPRGKGCSNCAAARVAAKVRRLARSAARRQEREDRTAWIGGRP